MTPTQAVCAALMLPLALLAACMALAARVQRTRQGDGLITTDSTARPGDRSNDDA